MFSHVTFGLTVAFLPIIAAIALEHPLKVNKSASALIGAGLLWTVYAIMGGDHLLISDNRSPAAKRPHRRYEPANAVGAVLFSLSHNEFPHSQKCILNITVSMFL